jgi:hypothetical protein
MSTKAKRPVNLKEVNRQLRRAFALMSAMEFERAKLCLALAKRLAPDEPTVDVQGYLCRALANDWGPHTWKLKARWRDLRTPRMKEYLLRRFDVPLWAGTPIDGQRLLCWVGDQGFGDTIHWIRFLPAIKLAAHFPISTSQPQITLEVPDGMARLFRGIAGGAEIIEDVRGRFWGRSRGMDYRPPAGGEAFDVHLPLDYFGAVCEITREIFQAPYLHAEPERVQRWAPVFADRSLLHVGVHFSVEASHQTAESRTTPTEHLRPFFDLPGIRWYHLNPAAPALAKVWPGIVDVSHEDAPGERFCETAAMISHLDLVLCADSSLGHLAGSMGAPVFLLLPKDQDPRWGLQPSTPWYPTHRLFRQTRAGQWDAVVEEAQKALAALGPGSSQAQ